MGTDRSGWISTRIRAWHIALLLIFSSIGGYLVVAPAWQHWELAQAEQHWANRRTTHYRMTIRVGCFCSSDLTTPARVEVVDGQIQSVTAIADGHSLPPEAFQGVAPIEQLFVLIHAQLEEDSSRIRVAYHPEAGYPTEIDIWNGWGMNDGQFGMSMVRFDQVEP